MVHLGKFFLGHPADSIWSISRPHLCLDIHVSLELAVVAVRQPTEAIEDLPEPGRLFLPGHLLDILYSVEGEVDVKT